MNKAKFEVLRDSEGIIEGYRLGNHYLMKHYTWNNNYSWIINTTGDNYYFGNEFWRLVDAGEIELALSCKQGKQRIIELENM